MVGVLLCGICRFVEREKALKFEEESEIMKSEEVINIWPLALRDNEESMNTHRLLLIL